MFILWLPLGLLIDPVASCKVALKIWREPAVVVFDQGKKRRQPPFNCHAWTGIRQVNVNELLNIPIPKKNI